MILSALWIVDNLCATQIIVIFGKHFVMLLITFFSVILSTYKSDEIINYISASDVAAVKNVKGIGLKTAQRIIIDLKDKVTKSAISDEISLDLNNTIQNEALSALVALGFSKKIAQQKIDKALTNKQGNFDVETLVRESLSQM